MRILMIVLLLSGCYSAEAIYEDGEKVEGCRGNAVSYTHLTLPTICSV